MQLDFETNTVRIFTIFPQFSLFTLLYFDGFWEGFYLFKTIVFDRRIIWHFRINLPIIKIIFLIGSEKHNEKGKK